MKAKFLSLALFALGTNACNAVKPVSSPELSSTGDTTDDAALSASDCPTGVPAPLAPPADQRLAFKFHATGSQVYVCTPNPAGTFAWLNVNPVANLYRAGWWGEQLAGTHFIGPTWQSFDGSNVQAAKVAAFTPPDGSIPWLLLKATSTMGPGRFANVTYVQRLSTTAGQPTGTCDATTAGTIQKSSYTADYFFYEQHAAGQHGNLQCNH